MEAAVNEVGENLKKGQLVILKSTVIVGTTEEFVLPKYIELNKPSISNPDGSVIAATNQSKIEKGMTSCMSTLWFDYYHIGI